MSNTGYAELIKIFNGIEQEMLGSISQADVIPHNLSKGQSIEEIFRNFLKERLPKSVSVGSGIIVDSNGKVSKQLDVIVYDSLKTPIFYQDNITQIIPVECVYAVIEVKKEIPSEEKLDLIIENMESVRALEKKAFFSQGGVIIYTHSLYGREWDSWPIQYYVFAIDSMDLDTLKQKIDEDNIKKSREPWNRLDVVCVLKKGLIFYAEGNGIWDVLPNGKNHLHVEKSGLVLLRFYGLTLPIFAQMNMHPFRFLDYISKIDP